MNINIQENAKHVEKSELDWAVPPLKNIKSTWVAFHGVAVIEILLPICSTFQSPSENKHGTRKNKITIIAKEIRVVISISIEYQMEKQNKQ